VFVNPVADLVVIGRGVTFGSHVLFLPWNRSRRVNPLPRQRVAVPSRERLYQIVGIAMEKGLDTLAERPSRPASDGVTVHTHLGPPGTPTVSVSDERVLRNGRARPKRTPSAECITQMRLSGCGEGRDTRVGHVVENPAWAEQCLDRVVAEERGEARLALPSSCQRPTGRRERARAFASR
jgi:hypothetical protein